MFNFTVKCPIWFEAFKFSTDIKLKVDSSSGGRKAHTFELYLCSPRYERVRQFMSVLSIY